VRDQLDMYGDLVYNTPGLTEAQLLDSTGRVLRRTRERHRPRLLATPGVVVIRDASFGVRTSSADTRYATMFAEGTPQPRTACS